MLFLPFLLGGGGSFGFESSISSRSYCQSARNSSATISAPSSAPSSALASPPQHPPLPHTALPLSPQGRPAGEGRRSGLRLTRRRHRRREGWVGWAVVPAGRSRAARPWYPPCRGPCATARAACVALLVRVRAEPHASNEHPPPPRPPHTPPPPLSRTCAAYAACGTARGCRPTARAPSRDPTHSWLGRALAPSHMPSSPLFQASITSLEPSLNLKGVEPVWKDEANIFLVPVSSLPT